jgi:hypothetical protein
MLNLVPDKLLVFCALCWGITNVVSGSKLTKPIRDWALCPRPIKALLNCYMCTAFWVGLLISLFFYVQLGICSSMTLFLPEAPRAYSVALGAVFDGFIGSGAVWVMFVVMEKLGASNL